MIPGELREAIRKAKETGYAQIVPDVEDEAQVYALVVTAEFAGLIAELWEAAEIVHAGMREHNCRECRVLTALEEA